MMPGRGDYQSFGDPSPRDQTQRATTRHDVPPSDGWYWTRCRYEWARGERTPFVVQAKLRQSLSGETLIDVCLSGRDDDWEPGDFDDFYGPIPIPPELAPKGEATREQWIIRSDRAPIPLYVARTEGEDIWTSERHRAFRFSGIQEAWAITKSINATHPGKQAHVVRLAHQGKAGTPDRPGNGPE